MKPPFTPDGNPDPFDSIQDDSVRRHSGGIEPTLRELRSSGIDPTLRESGVSGSSGEHEWTGVGSWRIRGKLGAGGEAELFVVGRDGGEVAILKAYVFEDGEAKQQPVMPDPEVLDAIRDLACPGLVQTFEHGVAAEGGCLAGRYCEVMEECEGQIQTQHWDDEAELLALVGQVTRALQALHSRRIAHRDVKPANILIGGMTERVYKLGDYGIATFANRRSRLARRDASPMYASPAQLSGLVSMTDDWWSLGMIVQESLLGRHPHAGKSPEEIQRSYVTQEFRPQVPRMVSDRWKPLLEGLLDYDPEKRWSHEEVLRWCEGGLAGKPPVGGSGVVGETAGWLRRSRLFLEDGEFESAEEYAERVLDREPETGEAYWVKALAGFGVRRETELGGWQQSLAGDGNYQKALRFGTAELKRRLEGIETDIQRRIAENRRKKNEDPPRAEAEEEKRLHQAAEARQRTEAEPMERARRQLDLAVEEDPDWVRTLVESLDPEEEEKAKLWLKQQDWTNLEASLKSVRLPENRRLIRLNAALSPIIDKSEWTYREAVALSIWISSRQFKQSKEIDLRKTLKFCLVASIFCIILLAFAVYWIYQNGNPFDSHPPSGVGIFAVLAIICVPFLLIIFVSSIVSIPRSLAQLRSKVADL